MTDRPLPLESIRVIEVTTTVAGPVAGRICSDLGAEVIRIEAPQRPDVMRGLLFIDNEPGAEHWNRGGGYHWLNLGKRSLTLNLEDPRGKETFRELVQVSDVVIENFSARVFPGWGLDYLDLVEIRPDIIMLSMTGYGRSGPQKDKVAYQPVMESSGGLPYLTGEAKGRPRFSDNQYADVASGLFGAIAILQALIQRRKTGRGQHLDLAGREVMISLIGETIVDFSLTGRMATRSGNASLVAAPQGVYRCRGADKWVAISVCGDRQWQLLVQVMGIPSLAEDERYISAEARRLNAESLDKVIEKWTIDREGDDVAECLQASGIAAASLLNAKDLIASEQLRQRGFFSWLEPLPEEGQRPYPRLLSAGPAGYKSRGPAPWLGEHNNYVLSELLGIDDERLAILYGEGIVGNKPQYDFRPEPLFKAAALKAGCAIEDKDFRQFLGDLAEKYRSSATG